MFFSLIALQSAHPPIQPQFAQPGSDLDQVPQLDAPGVHARSEVVHRAKRQGLRAGRQRENSSRRGASCKPPVPKPAASQNVRASVEFSELCSPPVRDKCHARRPGLHF